MRFRTLPTILTAGLRVATPALEARAAVTGAPAATARGRGAAAHRPSMPITPKARRTGGMVTLPAGTHRPLYGRAGDTPERIASFRLDRDPVTRADFLAFVTANAAWRRGAVKPVFAARTSYLADWRGDLDAGDAADLRRPVTGVSWFAAKAYCSARGKRLPTVAEWEYAAAASERARDAARDPRFIQRLVSAYASRPRPLPAVGRGPANAYGVRGLHDLAWEWVADFNSVLVSDDARGVGGRDHDLFCASAAIGALDPSNYPAFLRYAMRAGLTGRTSLETLGFRCAL